MLQHARTTPQRTALIMTPPSGPVQFTFAELAERVSARADELRQQGLRPGDRVLVLLPPWPDLFVTLLALAGSGLVGVVIEGGMRRRRALNALSDARAKAVVSVRALLRRWPLFPPLWRTKRFAVDGATLGVRALVSARAAAALVPVESQARDPALISFTSGSTGRPKGVDRTHGLLLAQHYALQALSPSRDGDVELSAFPVLALHFLCCGVPTVLPPWNPGGTFDAAATLQLMQTHRVTAMTVPPALAEALLDHCDATRLAPPRLRRIIVGGAPVPNKLAERLVAAFPDADCRIVYGSTEAEPIASVSMQEAVASEGDGFLVGRPVPEADVVVLAGEPPAELDSRGIEPYRAKPGFAGEVAVRGAHVNQRYVNPPHYAHKVRGEGGALWHCTGDVGRWDEQGRLWLVGRTCDAVQHGGRLVHPFEVEAAVGKLAGVHAAALVSHRRAPDGELVVELMPAAEPASTLVAIRNILSAHRLQVSLRCIVKMPMDARHHSKVDRPTLRSMLGRRFPKIN